MTGVQTCALPICDSLMTMDGIQSYGIVNITGGSVITALYAIDVWSGEVNIINGTVKGIYGVLMNRGTLNIKEQTIVTAQYVIYYNGGQVNISGGTFSSDPSEFVDLENYNVIENEDGTWTVKSSVVTDEASLRAAVLAGGKIKLGADITLTETLEIPADTTVVLDLNGKTLGSDSEEIALIYVIGNLTIKDSGETGKISFDYETVIKIVPGATVTLESGTIDATINAFRNNGDLRINGGLIIAGEVGISGGSGSVLVTGGMVEAVYPIVNDGATIGSFVITGGEFISTSLAGDPVIWNMAGTLEIQGGTFTISTANGANLVDIEEGALIITGGIFDEDPSQFVDTENYIVTNNEDGTWTVAVNPNAPKEDDSDDNGSEGNVVPEEVTVVTDEESLKTAIANGANIQLGADITLTENLLIENTVILDLNGKTLACAEFRIIVTEGVEVTIKDSDENGKIYKQAANEVINNSGKLFIQSGLIQNSDYGITNMGEIEMTGGTVKGIMAVNNSGGGVLTMKGGTIGSDGWLAIFNSENSQVIIEDGTLNAPENFMNSGTVTITGGNFNKDPSQFVDTENYTITDNGDGTWSVTAK